MKDTRAPLTVVVLTFNEERNLSACLDSVTGWARDVFVVDSGSADRTAAIAAEYGVPVVTHDFETHARQWQWALATLPIETEWVMGLDADQRVSPELRAAIATLLAGGTQAAGVLINRRQIFRRRWIRFGGYYPKYLLKMFRRDRVALDAGELVDHHFTVDGSVVKARGDLIEDNRNEASIAEWTAKHNRYAVLQARQELSSARAPITWTFLFASPDRRSEVLRQIWLKLPLYIRPCLYVFYRYVLRLGFLDGKEGLIFHLLQAFWYRLLVDINIDELRNGRIRTETIAPSRHVLRSSGSEPQLVRDRAE